MMGGDLESTGEGSDPAGAVFAVAAMSTLRGGRHEADRVREICERAAVQHRHHGLTGFLLHHKRELFGFLEGDRERVHALLDDLDQRADNVVTRRIELGVLLRRKCQGWEVRSLDGGRLASIGLETPLRAALRFRTAAGREPGQRELILRIVTRIAEQWDLADEPEARCP